MACACSADLTHGTQGVISKLSSTLHGPGGGMRQLPVVDLTDCVPYRMRQRQGLAGSISCSSTGRCKHTTLGPDLDAEWTHTVLAPGMVCPAAVDTLMSSVHAVSEVLHILAKFQPALSQNLFHDLIECVLYRSIMNTKFICAAAVAIVDRLVVRMCVHKFDSACVSYAAGAHNWHGRDLSLKSTMQFQSRL